MEYTLPEYYGWAYDYLRIKAESFEDVLEVLIKDEEFTDDVAEINGINEDDEELLASVVKELAPAMTAKLIENFEADQRLWKSETDNVRLTRALETLDPEIISVEGVFCCSSCGFYEMNENYKNNQYPDAKGFVFYNEQAAESAYRHGRVHLSYGSFVSEEDQDSLEVANKIVKALTDEGFNVKWNGNADTTLEISILWQRSFPSFG